MKNTIILRKYRKIEQFNGIAKYLFFDIFKNNFIIKKLIFIFEV